MKQTLKQQIYNLEKIIEELKKSLDDEILCREWDTKEHQEYIESLLKSHQEELEAEYRRYENGTANNELMRRELLELKAKQNELDSRAIYWKAQVEVFRTEQQYVDSQRKLIDAHWGDFQKFLGQKEAQPKDETNT